LATGEVCARRRALKRLTDKRAVSPRLAEARFEWQSRIEVPSRPPFSSPAECIRRPDRKLDYEQSLETYRQLADIRFKLLALVPTLSAAAVALLTTTEAIPRWERLGLAGLGFLATLGIVLYDQRNTQFYNGAIGRVQELEKKLGFEPAGGDREGGLFRSRKEHATRHLFGLPINHDLGLALVYAPVLGAWVFAAVLEGGQTTDWLALIAGVTAALAFLVQFLWLDGRPGWLQSRLRQSRWALRRPFLLFTGEAVRAFDRDTPVVEALRSAGEDSSVRAYDSRARRLEIKMAAVWQRPLVPLDARARKPKLTATTRRQRDVGDLRGALVKALSQSESKEKGSRPKLELELWSLSALVKEAKHRFGGSDESVAPRAGRSES
jgi:hypothetical protein